MKLKLDANLPESLLESLRASGHDTDNVRMEGLAGKPDTNVWEAAQASGRFLITQDLDFSDLRKYEPGTHAGLLLVRLHVPGRAALSRRLVELFQTEEVASWARCFVLVTERKIRVHRPK